MIKSRSLLIFCLILTGLLVAACGGSAPAEEAEPDRVATRVAEDLAVAATLTAAAPPAEASPASASIVPTEPAVAPTATLIPPVAPSEEAATAAPPPTDVPAPAATNTAPPPAPTDTPPPPPSPTPLLIAVLPVDGGGNDFLNIRNNNPVKDGRNVTLPGFSQNEVSDPMVFRDRIVFQAEVFDDNAGTNDGDGIEKITFSIVDSNGNLVHERTEENAGYCVFGWGEPDCAVLSLAERGATWPGGAQITSGLHDVSIDINPYSGDNVVWMWSYEIALPYQSESARINNITIQGDRYAVDFETFGFQPQLPGQHVHFFFNTVPQDQAGVPGGGPWILYGGPSPFIEYGVADRPASASQMCILIANPDHSVQANSGNCWNLP